MQNEGTTLTNLSNFASASLMYKWYEMDITWDLSTFTWDMIKLQQPPSATELDTKPTYQTSLSNL